MRALMVWVVLMTLPMTVLAQSARPEASADAVQIEQLKGEVERLKTALAELSARIDTIQPRPAPETMTSAPPVASTPPSRYDFYGDVLTRLSTIHQTYDGCATCPRRTVGRIRIRFGAEGHLAPGLQAVVGLATGELNDPNSVYQTLGGNLGRKVTSWDRAYLFFRPKQASWVELTAGKFPYPWLRSSMTYDVDFYPEGLSERFSFDLKRSGLLKNVSVQGLQVIVNEQAAAPDTLMVGGQVSATLHPSDALTSRLFATVMDIGHPENVLRAQIDGSDVGVRNTNVIVVTGGQAFYASGFRYANLIVENAVKTRWESLPFTATLEYQRNLQAVSDRDTAASLRLDAGRQQRAGDWQFGWHLFRLEQEAIVSSLGESDWRAPSNVWQHRIAASRMLHDRVQALFTWYRGRTLDRTAPGALVVPGLPAGRNDPWANRLYFDVAYRF